MQASLEYKQRLQQLLFPEGIAFDGNRFNRTAATARLFNYRGITAALTVSHAARISQLRKSSQTARHPPPLPQ